MDIDSAGGGQQGRTLNSWPTSVAKGHWSGWLRRMLHAVRLMLRQVALRISKIATADKLFVRALQLLKLAANMRGL